MGEGNKLLVVSCFSVKGMEAMKIRNWKYAILGVFALASLASWGSLSAATALTLQQRVAAAKAGDTITLAAGTFTAPVGAISLPERCKLLGAGSKLTRIVFVRTANSSTGIRGNAGNEIGGIAFDSDQPLATKGKGKVGINALRLYGHDFNLHDLTFSNVDDAVFVEASASGVGRNLANADSTIRGDFIFIGGAQGVTFEDCDCPGSHNEHSWRVDTDPETGADTAGQITARHCHFGNFDGKESMAFRTASGGAILVDDCDLDEWSRDGQVAPAGAKPPLMTIRSITYNNCRFHQGAFLQVDQGASAWLVNCTFDNFAAYCPLHATGPNLRLTTIGMKLVDQPNQPGINHDMVMLNGIAATDTVVINGVNMNPPKPAAKPAH